MSNTNVELIKKDIQSPQQCLSDRYQLQPSVFWMSNFVEFGKLRRGRCSGGPVVTFLSSSS